MPKVKESSDVTSGVSFISSSRQVNDRWPKLGIVTEPKWESLTKNSSLRRYYVEKIEERQRKKVLLSYSEGYSDSFFSATNTVLLKKNPSTLFYASLVCWNGLCFPLGKMYISPIANHHQITQCQVKGYASMSFGWCGVLPSHIELATLVTSYSMATYY